MNTSVMVNWNRKVADQEYADSQCKLDPLLRIRGRSGQKRD